VLDSFAWQEVSELLERSGELSARHRIRQTRKVVMACVASLAIVGTSIAVNVAPTAWGATARETDAGLTSFHRQHVAWAACDRPLPDGVPADIWREVWAGLECADVIVPMDYRRPRNGNLSIAVSRLKAKDPGKRQGVLLLNPGGPGALGQLLPKGLERNAIADSFDLIGFDPRGVGFSSRLECATTPYAGFETRPTDAQFAAIAEDARQTELACQRTGGGMRPHISTANTARDMDIIRAVLGERKINYLGFSYGTYLGAVYGSLFPSNLNRSVLDSSMHPDWFYYEASKQQAVAARQNVDAWSAWVGARDRTYHLGSSQAKVIATLEKLRRQLAVTPVPYPGAPPGFPALDGSLFDGLLGGLTPFRSEWDVMAKLVGEIRKGTTQPLPADAGKALTLLVKWAIEETRSGVYDTVTCEADWPKDLSVYYKQMRLFREKYPYGPGAMAAAPTTCTFRSFTPPEKLVKLQRKGYPIGLVVQAEFDHATQYEGGPAMASRLDHNLISVRDEGAHGIYGMNECVTKKVDDYLIRAVLPGSRTICPGAPRPNIPADGAVDMGAQGAHDGESLESRARSLVKRRLLDRIY
jgi:pimeloyl-ACP methyl ester carboxylesterase